MNPLCSRSISRCSCWRFLAAALVFFLFSESGFGASAKELLATGHVDEAVEALEQQISRSPNDAAAYNLLCRAHFMLEQWDASITDCEHARSLGPQNSFYHLWLARAYGEKADRAGFLSAAGFAKKSRASFERAVELDPANVEARRDLAEFYADAPGIVGGGKDKARAQADAISPLNPSIAHWVLGQIAERNKDLSTAEREYRASISESHSAVRAWVELAVFYRHTNRIDDMEQALHNAETAPIDHGESLLDAAGLLLRTGRDLPLAARVLRRCIASPAEDAPAFKAHDMLGQVLEKLGDRRSAAEEFRAALALAHTYKRAEEDLKRVDH